MNEWFDRRHNILVVECKNFGLHTHNMPFQSGEDFSQTVTSGWKQKQMNYLTTLEKKYVRIISVK